jgi:hypothetical protein
VFERGLLPEPDRLGMYRVVSSDQLPKLEEMMRRVGYLKAGGELRSP